MPFDGSNKAKDRGYQLVYALRNIHKLEWEWNFSLIKNECGTAGCAIGLAQKLWPELDTDIIDEDTITGAFGLPESYEFYWNIFDIGLKNRLGKKFMYEVTPEEVADALEKALDDAV